MPTSQKHARKILQEYGGTTEITACRQWHCLFCFDTGIKLEAWKKDSLIRSFAAYGTLLEASLVFCTTLQPSIHTWQAIISAHASHGQHFRVLELNHKIQEDGVQLDKYVFQSIVKSCGALGALQQGKLVHDLILRCKFECDGIIGCALLDMYARCGRLAEARNLFDSLPQQDVVAWGAMIAGYAQHKQGVLSLGLFEQMQKKGLKPTNITFLCVIKGCSSIGAIMEGNIIHDQIVRLKLESDVAIGNALIDMYAKCGSLDAAQNNFDRVCIQDVVSFSILIDAYVQHGHSFTALQIYERMRQKSLSTCQVTYLCVLKACYNIGALQPGMILHNDILLNNVELDIPVANTLIDMYANCGCLEEARRVFDLLPGRSIVSWGAMSTGYVQGGQSHCALQLYDKMQKERVKPDNGTYVSILKACGNIGCLERGKTVHKRIVDSGITLDTILGSTLIDMYARCEDLKEAEQVFSALPQRDVVSWSALITGHVNLGQHAQALELFKRMQQDGGKPDKVVFLCVIKACRSIGALNEGKVVHHLVKRHGLESDLIVASALIDMYAKSGNMDEAHQLFDGLPQQDAVVWGAIIAGYALNGDKEQVKKCTEEMRRQGLMQIGPVPSYVLSACSLSANIDEGQDLYKATLRDVDRPSIEHYNSAIDLFGRAGKLTDAEHMLQSMPIPADVVGWTALLTACDSHGNTSLGKDCYEKISRLDPKASFGHSLLSKLYADAGMWDEVCSIHEQRKGIPAFKKPGKAWIEAHNGVHEFTVQDASHVQSAIMYTSLGRLTKMLKQEGYVPQVNLVLEQGVKRKQEAFLQSDMNALA